MNKKIIGGYQNTKANNEDLAITPYLFGVLINGKATKVVGIGICWIYYSFYIGIAFGLSKEYPSFKTLKK